MHVSVCVCVFPEALQRREVQPSYYKTTNYGSLHGQKSPLPGLISRNMETVLLKNTGDPHQKPRFSGQILQENVEFYVSKVAFSHFLCILHTCHPCCLSGELNLLYPMSAEQTCPPPTQMKRHRENHCLHFKLHIGSESDSCLINYLIYILCSGPAAPSALVYLEQTCIQTAVWMHI